MGRNARYRRRVLHLCRTPRHRDRLQAQDEGRTRPWRLFPPERTITFADIVAGNGRGRTSDDQISYSERGNLQGNQFWPLAGRIYELAKAQGLGREIPTEWFLQDIRD